MIMLCNVAMICFSISCNAAATHARNYPWSCADEVVHNVDVLFSPLENSGTCGH